VNLTPSPTRCETPLGAFLTWVDAKTSEASATKRNVTPLSKAEREKLARSGKVRFRETTLTLSEALAMREQTKLLTSQNK
jgi:hypothetical protein